MQLNAIKQMERAARSDPEVISLSQGIPFRPSDARLRRVAVEAIKQGMADNYSDPQGLYELRQHIAVELAREGMQYQPSDIVVTAGAMEGLSVALRSVITAERGEIIVPTPVYAAYFKVVESARGQTIPITLDEAQQWRLDIEKVERLMTPRTAAILLCNPNNPTGSVYDKATLTSLARLASARGITLIIDEVYKNMLYDTGGWYTPAMDKAFRAAVIRIVSFSKDFSLTGWRVGFMHADSSRIPRLVAIHDTLVNCAPVVSQYAALAALKYQDDILAGNAAIYQRNLDLIRTRLDDLSDYLTYEPPKGAYFLFPKIKGVSRSVEFCAGLLASQKLAVVPGSAFGPGGEGHIRVCFGRSPSAIRDGMDRLAQYLRGER